MDLPGGSDGKESACKQETQVRSLGLEDPLEKGMATHSSVLAWRIPWREVPGRLQSTGSQRVGHDWATNTICSIVIILALTLCFTQERYFFTQEGAWVKPSLGVQYFESRLITKRSTGEVMLDDHMGCGLVVGYRLEVGLTSVKPKQSPSYHLCDLYSLFSSFWDLISLS